MLADQPYGALGLVSSVAGFYDGDSLVWMNKPPKNASVPSDGRSGR